MKEIKMENTNFKITEKGIVSCEIWKLQKLVTIFGIVIIPNLPALW